MLVSTLSHSGGGGLCERKQRAQIALMKLTGPAGFVVR